MPLRELASLFFFLGSLHIFVFHLEQIFPFPFFQCSFVANHCPMSVHYIESCWSYPDLILSVSTFASLTGILVCINSMQRPWSRIFIFCLICFFFFFSPFFELGHVPQVARVHTCLTAGAGVWLRALLSETLGIAGK